MCLILIAYKTHPKYQLILAANRDEFYQRPTLPLGYWVEQPSILAGKDLKGNGTWLGVTRTGRFAAITNYRDPANIQTDAPSRGLLITDYLSDERLSPKAYLKRILPNCRRYNGFNLLVGNLQEIFYLSNHTASIENVPPGIHGLSNHLLNSPWPKVQRGKQKLSRLVSTASNVNPDQLFTMLRDTSVPEDAQLPDTGVGIAWERTLAPMFIHSPNYGTRSSSAILVEYSGRIHFSERSYSQESGTPKPPSTQSYRLDLPDSKLNESIA